MNRLSRWIALGCCFWMVFLTACAPVETRPDGDETGALGAVDDKSAADIYVKLAIAYMQDGQMDQALKKIKRGLQTDPNSASAHNVIALIYDRLGEKDLAEKHYKQAVRFGPQDPYIRNAYGSFLCSRQQYEVADDQFNLALKNPLYKTPEVALINAGLCAGRAGQREESESYLRKALRLNPKFSPALKEMARVSLEKGSHLSARGYLQRYLEVAKHTSETLWIGIRTERELGDLDTVASYELLLRGTFPDSEEARKLEEMKRP